MDNAMQWVELISSIIGALIALCGLVPAIIALVKFIGKSIKDKNWKAILVMAQQAMLAAEASGKSGADKKQMVIDAVTAGCKAANIDIDEDDLKKLADYIDDWISKHNAMDAAAIAAETLTK
jgi:hypothetical protein